MEEEERLRVLEDEAREANEEIKRILTDIRGFLMEVNSPMRSDFIEERLPGMSNPD